MSAVCTGFWQWPLYMRFKPGTSGHYVSTGVKCSKKRLIATKEMGGKEEIMGTQGLQMTSAFAASIHSSCSWEKYLQSSLGNHPLSSSTMWFAWDPTPFSSSSILSWAQWLVQERTCSLISPTEICKSPSSQLRLAVCGWGLLPPRRKKWIGRIWSRPRNRLVGIQVTESGINQHLN